MAGYVIALFDVAAFHVVDTGAVFSARRMDDTGRSDAARVRDAQQAR